MSSVGVSPVSTRPAASRAQIRAQIGYVTSGFSTPRRARCSVPCSSPVPSIAAIPRAVADVSRLAKRPRSGLALTRRPLPRQSCSEGTAPPAWKAPGPGPLTSASTGQAACRDVVSDHDHPGSPSDRTQRARRKRPWRLCCSQQGRTLASRVQRNPVPWLLSRDASAIYL
jgi:hypothetical protein